MTLFHKILNFFLAFFVNLLYIVAFAQTQKINVFWKVQNLANLELFLFYQSGNF